MTEVWRNKDRYDPSRSLGAWVLGIANKRAIDHVRRRRRTAVPVEELYGIARTTDLQSGRQRTNWAVVADGGRPTPMLGACVSED
jgi:DNA-directed RNA polymerase specialized sigma24 family protein